MKAKLNISFLFLAGIIPLVLFILPMLGYKHILYKLDSYSPFWVFSLQLGFGLLLFIKLSKDFYIWLKELVPCPMSLVPVFLVISLTILTSIVFIEPRSRVQADESIHYVIAQNLYHNQIGQVCYEGSFMENSFACVLGETVKTRGLSYIYMLGMPFFGKHLYWVHSLHLFFLVFALLSFYLALLAWLKQHGIALLATALLASCPILLFCFRAASVEPIYVTLFCISLLFLKWAYDRNTTRHWLLLALILAFFAQTRSETVFCLFAFIGVAFFKTYHTPHPIPHTLLSVLNSQFSIFLAALSAFSFPVLCTLSRMRNHDLQGGLYGAHGHLFSNIVSDFKVMAFFHNTPDDLLKYPFLPYFTWLALFGLIMLIVWAIKEFKTPRQATPATPLKEGNYSILHSPFSIKYSHIALFILLLSPQYIILFDGVSADLTIGVQHRFALVILPAMAFLGALFLWKIGTTLHSQFSIFNSSPLLPKITLYGAVIIVLSTCLVQYKTFIKDTPNIRNFVTIEDYELHKWIRQEPAKRMLFFYWHTLTPLAHGHSSYSYQTLLDINSEDLAEILEDYNGEVYFTNTSSCDIIVGIAKMRSGNTFRECDRAMRYFNTEEVFREKIIDDYFKDFSIHKILGFNEIDSLGLLRIVNKIEPTDSTVVLYFKIPKERSEPWKVQHFVNDSLFSESPYKKDYYKYTYNISLFDRDTNVWRLDIVDSITNEKIHSDFWQLVRVKR